MVWAASTPARFDKSIDQLAEDVKFHKRPTPGGDL
jgi:hypothetical protein